MYSEHCQTFKMEHFPEKQGEGGGGGGAISNQGTSTEYFVKNTRKMGPAGKHFEFISPRFS